MKLNSFRAKNVHGYLNFDIIFYPDLTFLIGINGSGKTSALKLILGLTAPEYNYLTQLDYDFCEVVCSTYENEKDVIIRSEQVKSENAFRLRLFLRGEQFDSEYTKRFVRTADSSYDESQFSILEQQHREIFEGFDVTQRIKSLATPKFLGLDRKITDIRSVEYKFRNRTSLQQTRANKRRFFEGYPDIPAIDSSLDDVQSLIFDYIRKIPQQQYQITEVFKEQIFSQSFVYLEQYNIASVATTQEIAERKERVLAAIRNLGLKYLNNSINSFFSKIESITTQFEALPPGQKDLEKNTVSQKAIELLRLWYNNAPQLKRIDDIIKYSQSYQERVANLRAPLKRMESIVTNFLKEGGKSVSIAADGEIKVTLRNSKTANVYELSSGEKQIIIMIAHLIFEEDQKPSGIFIIDEPELSLHIAWQQIFVSSIMEASPKTQFILATHSPSIIARVDKERHCQDLNKLNFF